MLHISVVHGRAGDLGSLYQFSIQALASITLSDLVAFLLSNMAYDAIRTYS